MSGRNRMPRHSDNFRGFRDVPRPVMNRGPGPGPMTLHHAALEEELEIQHRDIQRIVAENRNVIDDNTILQRELEGAKDEIYRLGEVIPKLRADREVQTRELIERGFKLEAELRANEPLRAEVMQLRAEAQKLNSLRQDLSGQVQGLTKDITRLQVENQQLIIMKADVDAMRKELAEHRVGVHNAHQDQNQIRLMLRRAFDYEKKANEEQMEQKQAMEKNLVSMAREIEKLRAEQMNTERRARGLGGGSYGMLNGSPDMRYPGGAFGDGYGGSWGSYDKRGPPRR